MTPHQGMQWFKATFQVPAPEGGKIWSDVKPMLSSAIWLIDGKSETEKRSKLLEVIQ